MASFNTELVCCQKWILATFFSVLAPTFPTRSSLTFRTVPQGAGVRESGLQWHSRPWNLS